MGSPNAALFPNGLAVPDIDGANPSKLDPGGQVWEPREGFLRILGAWNINNVTRAPVAPPATPAFGHIHITVPAALTGADPATTTPQAVMWNGTAWVDMTPVAYQCAMIKLGLPCAISSAAGNTVTVGPDGGIYVAGAPVTVVPIQTVSGPLVLSGTNVDINFALMDAADRAAIVGAICADAAAKDALADCLVSPNAGNALVSAGNGLFVPSASAPFISSVSAPLVAAAGNLDINFCAMTAADIACLVSGDAGNGLTQGADGKLFSAPGSAPPAPHAYSEGGIVVASTAPAPAGVAGVISQTTTNITIANPSSDRSAVVSFDAACNTAVAKNASALSSSLAGRALINGAVVAMGFNFSNTLSDSAAGAAIAILPALASASVTLAPGASVTVALRAECFSSAGYDNVIVFSAEADFRWRIHTI